MRSEFNFSSPSQTYKETHTHSGDSTVTGRTQAPGISTLYYFILPPLHPLHSSVSHHPSYFHTSFSSFFRLASLLSFTTSICISLSATFVTLVLSIQHRSCSCGLSLPLVFPSSLSFVHLYALSFIVSSSRDSPRDLTYPLHCYHSLFITLCFLFSFAFFHHHLFLVLHFFSSHHCVPHVSPWPSLSFRDAPVLCSLPRPLSPLCCNNILWSSLRCS